MRHSTRTKLFLVFVVLFVVATPFVVFYSQGYRIDFENKLVVKTGALFFEPRPAPVEIYLNGKLRKRSNFVFQNVYIGNLLPRNYSVEIRKDGYLTWKKELSVLPKLVTEAKNVILFRTSHTPALLTYNAADFYFAPSKNYIAIVKKSQIPQVNLYDIGKREEFVLLELHSTSTDQIISQIEWNSDSSRLAVLIKDNDVANWLIVESQNYSRKKEARVELDITEYAKNAAALNITQVFWSKDDPAEIFLIAIDENGRSTLLKYNDRTLRLSIPLAVFHPQFRVKHIQFITSDRLVLLTESNDAYFYDLKTSRPEKIFGGIKKIAASPDAKKLMFAREDSILVYWLDDVHIQPFHDAGDKLEIVQTNSTILDAAWFTKTGEYIVFTTGDSLEVIELDRRGGQNIHSLIKTLVQKIFYEENKDTLYYLAESVLYALSLE